jgi:hypothetical protein
VCIWGHPTSPTCPYHQGQAGPLFGQAFKSPNPFPNTTQVSIIYHKESEAHGPLVLHVTIMHPRCSYSHIYDFIHLSDHIPLVFSCPTSLQVHPRSVHALWVSWRALHSPPLQVVVVLGNIHRSPWHLYLIFGSCHYSTTTISTIVVKGSSS